MTLLAQAVPVDGIRPKFGSMIFGGSHDTWYSGALSAIATLSGAAANVAKGCAARNKDPGVCLYANETLPFVATPIFAVQEMPAVWDYQCMCVVCQTSAGFVCFHVCQ